MAFSLKSAFIGALIPVSLLSGGDLLLPRDYKPTVYILRNDHGRPEFTDISYTRPNDAWGRREINFRSRTGMIVSARRENAGGLLHDLGGPAVWARDPATGVVIVEAWYRHGLRHRADGPAYVERDRNTGEVIREGWFRDGEPVEPGSVHAAAEKIQPHWSLDRG